MNRTIRRLLLAALLVCAGADIARAGILPGGFSFADSAINAVFLWPFRISGCG